MKKEERIKKQNESVIKLMKKYGTVKGIVDSALYSIGRGVVEFDKCAGCYGIGQKSLLRFLIRNYPEKTSRAISESMEKESCDYWRW